MNHLCVRARTGPSPNQSPMVSFPFVRRALRPSFSHGQRQKTKRFFRTTIVVLRDRIITIIMYGFEEERPSGLYDSDEYDEEGDEGDGDVISTSRVDEEAGKTYGDRLLARTPEGKASLEMLIARVKDEVSLKYNERLLQFKARYKAEKLKARKKIERLRRKAADAESKVKIVADLKRRASEDADRIEDLERRLALSERRCAAMDASVESMRKEKDALRAEISSLKSHVSTLKTQRSATFFDTERLHIQIQTMREMKEYVAKQWEESEANLGACRKRLRAIESEKDEMKAKLHEAEAFKTFIDSELSRDQNEDDASIRALARREMRRLVAAAENYQIRHPAITMRESRGL